MKPPILNHVALTVPRSLVSDTNDRRRLLEFYERVFGWRSIDVMRIEGERIVLHLHQLTHFLYLIGGDVPLSAPRGDHFGIEVYEREALDAIVDRAKAFRAENDPAARGHRNRGLRNHPHSQRLRALPAPAHGRGPVLRGCRGADRRNRVVGRRGGLTG
jgi:hypothetical protein